MGDISNKLMQPSCIYSDIVAFTLTSGPAQEVRRIAEVGIPLGQLLGAFSSGQLLSVAQDVRKA